MAKIFETVADLTAATLTAGQIVTTKGYFAAGDGGQASYLIKTAVEYGGSPDGYGDHTLANGNVAVLQSVDAVNVKQYGAVGDGVADDTAAIQAALDYAATAEKGVKAPAGNTYLVSTLLIKNGLKYFKTNKSILLGKGTTNPNSLTTEAVIVLQGALTGGTPVDNCLISVDIDMQNGDRRAILADGSTGCTFENCRIYGFTNDATYNHYGIRLQEGAARNKVINNEIVGAASPTQRGLLIDVYGSLTGFLPFGNFFTGTVSRQPTPADRNIISGNVLTNGSYGCSIQGAEYTVVSNNVMHNQNHRGIWMGNGSWYNTIEGNNIREYLSSGVLMGYSCCHNVLANNNFYTTVIDGEAAINITTGSSYNLIEGNNIDGPTRYSVYIATDSSYNQVIGNYSINAYRAAFAVENDWIDTLPTNNFYGRANYDDPDVLGGTSWTFNDLVGTVFQNNVVVSGYTGRNIAAFYIGQVENSFAGATATDLIDVVLQGNSVLSATNIGYALFVYEHVSGQLNQIKCVGNTFDSLFLVSTNDFAAANTTSAALDLRDVGLVYCENNGQLDELVHGQARAFADADATPSVAYWRFYKFANTGATNVTAFDGGYDGQEIVLRGDVNTTIVYSSGAIRPKGLVNVTGMNGNSLIGFKRMGTVWHETFRNF